MKEILLNTGTSISRILVGEMLENTGKYLPDKNLVVISDENVARFYSDFFPEGLHIVIPSGEASKSLSTVAEIYGRLIEKEIDRTSFLLGIGGGIVCDLAGYVASTYLRGIPFGFVSTTLLGQVDASIGGKNGVNYEGYKNMVGIIRQPDFVLCDPATLKTLDPAEFRNGFAEVVKYGAIFDSGFFSYLEANCKAALQHDTMVLNHIIYSGALAKCRIVEADENETGDRKKLNFGHTFAHAFEKISGIPHGEAVSIGMVMAAGLSEKLGMITKADVSRLRDLLKSFGLPVTWNGSCSDVIDIMKRDKKRGGDKISLILLDSIGNADIKEIKITELKNWIDDLCSPVGT